MVRDVVVTAAAGAAAGAAAAVFRLDKLIRFGGSDGGHILFLVLYALSSSLSMFSSSVLYNIII